MANNTAVIVYVQMLMKEPFYSTMATKTSMIYRPNFVSLINIRPLVAVLKLS